MSRRWRGAASPEPEPGPASSWPLDRPERLGHLGPVHDVPPGVDVVRPAVLVVEVVRVLPDVDAEEWRLARGDRAVLIRRCDDGESGAVVHEPGPAGPELPHSRRL